MRILYAGDSRACGPANYLLGVLKWVKAGVVHLPPDRILNSRILSQKFDAFIFSDFPKKNLPAEPEEIILRQVKEGSGLAMIGGWASFSGPLGGWSGSRLESLLPVSCLGKDDRMNFPSGASLELLQRHKIFDSLSFQQAPVICGMNRVIVKRSGRALLNAREIRYKNERPFLGKAHPLLIVSKESVSRTAAFTSDFAPHWCGGLVDWGRKALRITVTPKVKIEVGESYVKFISSLIRWLAGANR